MSWLLVVFWVLAIFATVPIARTLQALVSDRLGRSAFGYLTLAAVALATLVMARYLARSRQGVASYVWLALVAVIFVVSTIRLWRVPEEAAHFVQYGLLGVLAYRALAWLLSIAVRAFFRRVEVVGLEPTRTYRSASPVPTMSNT